MTTVQKEKIARRKLSLPTADSGAREREQTVQDRRLQPSAVLRDPAQLPALRAEGLIDQLPGAKGSHASRVSEEVERAILAHALEHPTHGRQRVAAELLLNGVQVNSNGVRGIWIRHGLTTKRERLLRLEETARQLELTGCPGPGAGALRSGVPRPAHLCPAFPRPRTDPIARLERSPPGSLYRVERQLGEGGMAATVYPAHDLRHERKVALKVLKLELSRRRGRTLPGRDQDDGQAER